MNATTLLLPPVNVYLHGTYRSEQRTCRLDQVVLVVGGGVGIASGVSTAGRGGKRASSVAVTSIVIKSSMCAGFRRSSDNTCTSCLLLTSTVNVLVPHLMTLWGLWYGCSKVRRTVSRHTKTWVQWERLLLTKGLCFMWWRVGVACSFVIISFSLVT